MESMRTTEEQVMDDDSRTVTRRSAPASRRRPRLTAAVLIGLLGLTGCGAEDDGPDAAGEQAGTRGVEGEASDQDDSGQSGSDQPDSEEPGSGSPDAEQPGGDQSEAEQDDSEQDDSEQPDADQPDPGGSNGGVGDIDVDSFTTEAKQSEDFPSSTDPAEDELLLDTVRVGTHPDFDRAVFEHAGDGMPAWRVEYVEEPTQPGSGRPVDMPGEAFIAVHVGGLRPGNAGEEAGHQVGVEDWSGSSDTIASTYSTVVFEGSSTYYIGLDEKRPFEVLALVDAPRLVIDVADEA